MRPSKRETLLDTADRLFYEEGFHATGIDRVVEVAGVARMTLYNHFDSKEALVMAVLERRQQDYFASLYEAAVGGDDEPLLAVVDAHCRWLGSRSRRGCMLLKAMAEYEAHLPAVHELAIRYKRELYALIQELLASSGIVADGFVDDEILLALEGSNSLVQILGPERTAQQTRAMVARLLAPAVAEAT